MFFAFEFRTIRGSFTMSLQCPFSKLMYLLINKSIECECKTHFIFKIQKGAVFTALFFYLHSKSSMNFSMNVQ